MSGVPDYSRSELETRMNDCARQCVDRVLMGSMEEAMAWALQYEQLKRKLANGEYAEMQDRSFPYNLL